uniref:Ig-like domain-containing protein n=1 Tax=Labrus bergylta TaxID=56723 RepID=A0A3Q3E6I3_9LABR
RVQVSERERGRSTLRISDLRENAPKLPSVSVSPSAEIVEGSSVTLTCSSDANPAAKYTWFKENLLKGQGQSYYFPSIRSEDRGIYYCQAENKHGQIKSLQHLLDVQYTEPTPQLLSHHHCFTFQPVHFGRRYRPKQNHSFF